MHIELLDADGRLIREIVPPPGGIPEVRWSPDGERLSTLAFLADPRVAPDEQFGAMLELTVVNLDGRPDRTLTLPDRARSSMRFHPGPVTVTTNSAWSGDGRSIVVAGWSGPGATGQAMSIWAVDADGAGTREVLSPDADLTPARLALDPTTGRLALVGTLALASCIEDPTPCRDAFWTMPVSGGPPTMENPDTPGDRYLNVAWAPDGRHLALRRQVGEFVAPGVRTPRGAIDIWDEAGRVTELLEGSKGIPLPPVPPPLVDVNRIEDTPVAWLDDSTVVYLSSTDGDEPGMWSVRRQDITGGPPVVLVRDATTFDVVVPGRS
jgi:dipeptidyl aminopeptidase/acylaminoacyl peptidase